MPRALIYVYLLSLWAGIVQGAAPGAAPGAAMGYDEARLLLARSGFAPQATDVHTFAGLTRQQAVDRLLAGTTTTARTPPPGWVNEALPQRQAVRNLPEDQRRMLVRENLGKGFELRAWWYREMLDTPTPLTERMTLFWHNHFVSSLEKVKAPHLMYRQNVLLRRHALGNFRELLHAIAKDPAMVVYLDSAANRRGQPNENFAREVMELFTLGVGQYTEQDVKEAARAFTGWSLDRATYEFRFYPFLHDSGEKQVLGRNGKLDGGDVLDILLAQPATAEFIVTKLWREFVSPQPPAAEVKRLAGIMRAAHYDIKPVLRALFLSDAFYAQENRAALIKSPVELLVGTARQFGIGGMELRLYALAGRQLGQDIFAPPNVKGWPGGEDWINSTTLLGRKQVLARLFHAEEMPMRENAAPGERRLAQLSGTALFDAERFFAAFNGDERTRRKQAEKLVLAMPPSQIANGGTEGRIEFVRQLVLDPAYQLK